MDNIQRDIEKEYTLRERFLEVLENKRISTVFQPIVSLSDGSVYGYEALSRGPQNTDLQSPGVLFECADKYDKTWDLELLCRVKAIEAAGGIRTPFKLFLNVNPNIIHDAKFKQGFTKEYLSQYEINPENIIFEITEKGAVSNISDFICTIDNYKGQNYKIAIDDAGAGYSGLNMISDIHPHFIKLDMKLIRDIDKDVTKQLLIKSFAEFASLTNTYLIAEGIETKNELLKLIDIGVHFGQGYYLQRPNASLNPISGEVLLTINEENKKKHNLADKRSSDIFISNISTAQKGIEPDVLVLQVLELMEKDRSISGICVAREGYIVGTLTRRELYRRLSGRYGYTLFSKKTVENIMSTEFLCVDCHESIRTVSKKAMSRDFEKLYDFIAVTKDGKHYGIVTVKDLLEKTIQVEVNNAKHLNPLSELPGNVLIEKKLEEIIGLKSDYTVIYFDIDNFKAYNDVYGFENGDRIIKHLTQILKNNFQLDIDFVGHIGGDDFIAVIADKDVEAVCKKIIAEFDESVKLFYSQNDLDKGYITTKNRHGAEEDFPILSISIVSASGKGYETVYKMAEDIAKLKKLCKQNPGSNYLLG